MLALVVHVLLRLRAPYADPTLLPIAITINGVGLAMIHRIDLAKAEHRGLLALSRRSS